MNCFEKVVYDNELLALVQCKNRKTLVYLFISKALYKHMITIYQEIECE